MYMIYIYSIYIYIHYRLILGWWCRELNTKCWWSSISQLQFRFSSGCFQDSNALNPKLMWSARRDHAHPSFPAHRHGFHVDVLFIEISLLQLAVVFLTCADADLAQQLAEIALEWFWPMRWCHGVCQIGMAGCFRRSHENDMKPLKQLEPSIGTNLPSPNDGRDSKIMIDKLFGETPSDGFRP